MVRFNEKLYKFCAVGKILGGLGWGDLGIGGWIWGEIGIGVPSKPVVHRLGRVMVISNIISLEFVGFCKLNPTYGLQYLLHPTNSFYYKTYFTLSKATILEINITKIDERNIKNKDKINTELACTDDQNKQA